MALMHTPPNGRPFRCGIPIAILACLLVPLGASAQTLRYLNYTDQGPNAYARKCALDTGDNWFILGQQAQSAKVGADTNCLVRKVSPRGIVGWRKTLEPSKGYTNYPAGIGTDAAGNCYVAIGVVPTLATTLGSTLQLYKYSPDGTLLGTKTYEFSGFSTVVSNAQVNASGCMCVTGYTQTGPSAPTRTFVAAFDSSQAEVGLFTPTSGNTSAGYAVHKMADGSFVTTTSEISPSNSHFLGYNRVSPTGVITAGASRLVGTASARLFDAAVSPVGDVVACGFSKNQAVVMSFGPSGNWTWKSPTGAYAGFNNAWSLDVATDGTIVVGTSMSAPSSNVPGQSTSAGQFPPDELPGSSAFIFEFSPAGALTLTRSTAEAPGLGSVHKVQFGPGKEVYWCGSATVGNGAAALASGVLVGHGLNNYYGIGWNEPYQVCEDMSVDMSRGLIFGCGILEGASNAPNPGGNGTLGEEIQGLGAEGVDDAYTTSAGKPLAVNSPGVLANDYRAGGGTATLSVSPTHGTVKLNPNGAFTYTPNAGYTGPDSFQYSVSNESGSSYATVTLTVTGP